ncbi:MAG TPA: magnesium transporter [Gemmatimonadales bacterium]|nr:magnesium transporter [Gemmatimonadales bacterium]
MTGSVTRAVQVVDSRFLREHPWEAALKIEELEPGDVAPELANLSAPILAPVWRRLSPRTAAAVTLELPDDLVAALLSELMPTETLPILAVLEEEEARHYLARLAPPIRTEIEQLMTYPVDSAGRIMNTRVAVFRQSTRAGDAIASLRGSRIQAGRDVFLLDDQNRLAGHVPLQDAATAEPDIALATLAKPLAATVTALTPREDVAELVERYRLADLPVVDVHGHLLGVIPGSRLMQAMQENLSADIQTMTGASADERALSKPMFAVRKRLPWLQINLLTAFLAAAVVGMFESTIAQFTALAVLLPVVAGQSGNAGAQALAVTMRGLVLREISPRQWLAVSSKEASVGLLNGIAIAITAGLGVYLWSRSVGLVLVIALSMLLAMVVAGLAGALVPITLRRLGLDPAQSSSIVLTTVTDIAGFLGFLGIATLLSGML